MIQLGEEEIARAVFENQYAGNSQKNWESADQNLKAAYLNLGRTVIEVLAEKAADAGGPRPYPAQLLDDLAWQLAYKYANPGHFVNRVRETFENYVKEVGAEKVDPLVLEALDRW